MALGNVYGVNYTKAFVSVPAVIVEQGESGGKVKCIYDSYTLPGAVLDTAAVVTLGAAKLPKGAKVVDAVVKCASLGTTGIVSLGYAASADGVEAADVDAFVTADAGGQAVLQKPVASAAGILKEFSADVALTLTCSEASTNSDVKIEVAVFYIVD